MTGIFLKILNMGLAAGWLIVAVIMMRFVLKRAPKWIMPMLWGLVGLRLLIPISLESSFSLIPSAEPLPREVLVDPSVRIDSGVSVIDDPVNGYLGSMESTGTAPGSWNQIQFMKVLGALWIAGIGMMLVYAFISYLRIRRKVSTSAKLYGNVRICDQVASPFILGVLRPVIYLPSGLGEDDQRHVLAHEKAHLKRGDHLWKPLGFLLLCIYWFHPLVWVAYVLLCRDIELACDEKVIADLDIGQKKAYATALLDCSMQRRMVTVCPLAFGEVGVKERVKAVLNYKKPAFFVIAAALVLCVAVAICFLSNPKRKTYDLTVRIPAGAVNDYYFANELVWSHGKHITLLSKSGDLNTDVELVEVGDPTEFYDDEDTVASVFHMGNDPVKLDVEKNRWYRIGVRTGNTDDKFQELCIQARGVDVLITERSDSDIELYRTEYIGDAPKVAGIARRLHYPSGYRFSSIEIQSKTEPYGLTVFLEQGDTIASGDEGDFATAAEKAFGLIANMGSIEFCEAESERTLAHFERSDFESGEEMR